MADHTERREFLGPDDADRVAEAVLALARELWVVTDRLMILEAVLANRGISVSADIENFEPDPELQARLDQRRDALIAVISSKLAGNEVSA